MKKIITLILLSALYSTHNVHPEEFVTLSTLSDEPIRIHARYAIEKRPSADTNSDYGQPIPHLALPLKTYELGNKKAVKIPITSSDADLLKLEKIKIICNKKNTTIENPTAGAYLIIYNEIQGLTIRLLG